MYLMCLMQYVSFLGVSAYVVKCLCGKLLLLSTYLEIEKIVNLLQSSVASAKTFLVNVADSIDNKQFY